MNRPTGRALVVGAASARERAVEALQRVYGFECATADDPYHAMLELCRRRLAYAALVLSLAGMYREELTLVATVKRRFPHLEIWLAHTDGRQASLAEAMRLGADGLLADDGLHRIAAVGPASASLPEPIPSATEVAIPEAAEHADAGSVETAPGEPVLTSDELRALLQDQPSMPPSGSTESSQS